jgi:hypothetical protein
MSFSRIIITDDRCADERSPAVLNYSYFKFHLYPGAVVHVVRVVVVLIRRPPPVLVGRLGFDPLRRPRDVVHVVGPPVARPPLLPSGRQIFVVGGDGVVVGGASELPLRSDHGQGGAAAGTVAGQQRHDDLTLDGFAVLLGRFTQVQALIWR